MNHICKYCGKEFDSDVKLGGHITKCKNNPNTTNNINKIKSTKHKNAKFNIYKLKCAVCGNVYEVFMTEYKYKIGAYKKCCCKKCSNTLTVKHPKNRNINISKGLQKFLKTQQNKNPKIKICEECGKEYIQLNASKFCSKDCMIKHKHKKLSNLAKLHNFGGFNQTSLVKYHTGYFNGIRYDSSWELAFLLYHFDNNIPIKRCNEIRTYTIDGVQKRYFPDFIVNNKIYEIKGYMNDVALQKSIQNQDIIVLQSVEMQPYLNYAINKYGKNFYETVNDNAAVA